MRFILPFFVSSLALWLSACRPCEFPEREAEKLRVERFGEHGEFLRNADRLEIYSLASTGMSEMPGKSPTDNTFHEFQIYGMVETSRKADIKSIWSNLHQNVNSTHSHSIVYCFWPRHGVRAHQGDTSRDYVICFECLSIQIFENSQSEKKATIALQDNPDISNLKMDQLLDAAQIPRERRAK